jgi:hypothetical protein
VARCIPAAAARQPTYAVSIMDETTIRRRPEGPTAPPQNPIHVQIDGDRSGDNADRSLPSSHLHALEEGIRIRIRASAVVYSVGKLIYQFWT